MEGAARREAPEAGQLVMNPRLRAYVEQRYAIQAAATPSTTDPAAGYIAAIIGGAVLLAAAFAMSFAIPRPVTAEATAARVGAVH